MKILLTILTPYIITFSLSAQSFVGLSFGRFNVPGAMNSFGGFGSTAKFEYIGNNDNQSAYLDVSLYIKKYPAGETDIVNEIGTLVGRAETIDKYIFKHVQLGFKLTPGRRSFSDQKVVIFFFGGGAAVSFLTVRSSYDLPGYEIEDSKYNRILYGFHFNSGLQYNLESVSFELKGAFDLMIRPIVEGSGVSNIITGLRFGVLIPFTRN